MADGLSRRSLFGVAAGAVTVAVVPSGATVAEELSVNPPLKATAEAMSGSCGYYPGGVTWIDDERVRDDTGRFI